MVPRRKIVAALFALTLSASAEQQTDRRLIFEGPLNNTGRDSSILLYEAAMSGAFDSVYYSTRWYQRTKDDDFIWLSADYELQAVDDWDVCSQTPSPPHGRIEGLISFSTEQPVLFQPESFDHLLVTGRCVVAYPTSAPVRGVRVRQGFFDFFIENTRWGQSGENIGDLQNVWKYFSLTRPEQYDLWSEDGSSLRDDEVSDQDLVQAIRFGGEMQRAALKVVANRTTLSAIPRKPIRTRESRPVRRPTDKTVSDAIIESQALLNPKRRPLALRALTSVNSTERVGAVLDQLFLALEQVPEDSRGDGEKAWQLRAESSLGTDAFGLPNGQPAYQDMYQFAQAAEFVNTLSDEAVVAFAKHYEETLRDWLLTQLVVDQSIVLLAARSDFRDELITELMAKVAGSDATPSPVQSRIGLLLTKRVPLSPELTAIISRSCDQTGSLAPNGSPKTLEEVCSLVQTR